MFASRLLVSLGLMALLTSGSFAQSRRPGVWHGDRFVGFRPAHERGPSAAPPSHSHPNPMRPAETPEKEPQILPAPEAIPEVAPLIGQISFQEESSQVPIEPIESLESNGLTTVPHDPTTCVDACCGSCDIWMRADYLLWWTRGMRVPALATRSDPGTARANAGVLGLPTTSLLFGDDELNDDARSGVRLNLGMWLDAWATTGIEASYLYLGDADDGFNASSDGTTILARPFFNVQTGLEDARLIGFPEVSQGTLSINASTAYESFDVMLRRNLGRGPMHTLDFLLGYRYSRLEDSLRFVEATESLETLTLGTTFLLQEQFQTRNEFHGVQLGGVYAWQHNACWSMELLAKIGLGTTNAVVQIAGETTVNDSATNPGGLLAQETNIGTFERNNFTAITELGFSLRRHLECGVDFTCGYSFVYWSEVARAGNQIDRNVNLSQLPPGNLTGTPAPMLGFAQEGFWAQGLHFGLEYNY